MRVRALVEGGRLELSVTNTGEPISSAAHAHLFKPFHRASVRPRQAGLGLGLWICSEIAKAHADELEVASDSGETRFTLRMPVNAPLPVLEPTV